MPSAHRVRHATSRERRSTHPTPPQARLSHSAWLHRSCLQYIRSRTAPPRRKILYALKRHDRRDSCTRRSYLEVASKAPNFGPCRPERRSRPHSSPRLVHSRTRRRLPRSCLQGAELARGLPRETRHAFIPRRAGYPAVDSAVLGLPPGEEHCCTPRRGAVPFPRQQCRFVSRIGGLIRLGEPLPRQLTSQALTNPSYPTPVSNCFDMGVDGSTHRCQWLDPTGICRSTCGPHSY